MAPLGWQIYLGVGFRGRKPTTSDAWSVRSLASFTLKNLKHVEISTQDLRLQEAPAYEKVNIQTNYLASKPQRLQHYLHRRLLF